MEISKMPDIPKTPEVGGYKEIRPESGTDFQANKSFWDKVFGAETSADTLLPIETDKWDISKKDGSIEIPSPRIEEIREEDRSMDPIDAKNLPGFEDHLPEISTAAERDVSENDEKGAKDTKDHGKGLESDTQDSEQAEKADAADTEKKCLTDEEKEIIKKETGWSDEIIDLIDNMDQYKILKDAGLIEAEIDGRKCLIKENIDLDYTDEDGMSNRMRMAHGLAPLDSKTGKPIELHHLGQKADSPLVELTNEEHRTGEYKDGKKNQSLWHDNAIETKVHGEGNTWDKERTDYWKSRAENSEEKII